MKKLLSILFVLICVTAGAQTTKDKIHQAFLKLASEPAYRKATISLLVKNTKDGSVLISKNADVGLASASTLKIITSATAYELLGKGYTYKTPVVYRGTISNGVLNGDLIIKGSGDPTFGSWRYAGTKETGIIDEIINNLSRSGINDITGHVFVDESLMDGEVIPDGWIWQDIGNYYGAGARSFNWRENQFDLFLKSGSTIGSPVSISGTNPNYITGLHLASKLKSAKAGSGDNAYIYLPLFGKTGYVRGTIPVNENRFSISGTMPDPARQFAITLEAALKKKPVEDIDKEYPSVVDVQNFNTDRTAFQIQSPALDSISYWFLQKSINLYGEALLKTIAVESGKEGSTQEGVNVTRDFWKKKNIGIANLGLIDGSGLSPQNRITTNDLVSILLYAQKQSWFSSYFSGFPVINGIKMKSGSINKVVSYTGIIKGKSGEYAFAFIINNFDGASSATRNKMWALLDILK
ncbi:MAG: D-alanyl-D-alanine carboxypeptidase/D-alanyl-D-alanine-endopeptidase [Chitinophagaceae bacterium]|nr:D-alanyl-D-alanine carboxypeptidase/D-alanyl-D-alanine-endopeptidase [Chitinophagaceae bacterium]